MQSPSPISHLLFLLRFLVSTHYTHYDLPTFLLNLTSTLIVVIAKSPQLHKQRFFGINKIADQDSNEESHQD